MKDIDIAKKHLKANQLSLVIVKAGEILYESGGKGIRPLYQIMVENPELLHGASVADKVTGATAARLCIEGGIVANYASLISQAACQYLEEAGIDFQYDALVDNITNRDGSDLCPMEKISQRSDEYGDLMDNIDSFLQNISSSPGQKGEIK